MHAYYQKPNTCFTASGSNCNGWRTNNEQTQTYLQLPPYTYIHVPTYLHTILIHTYVHTWTHIHMQTLFMDCDLNRNGSQIYICIYIYIYMLIHTYFTHNIQTHFMDFDLNRNGSHTHTHTHTYMHAYTHFLNTQYTDTLHGLRSQS